MDYLEHGLSLFNLPTEAKHWTLVAKKLGERFSHVEEAVEYYIKCWFNTEKEQVAKRRMFEVQTTHQSKTSSTPRPGGGGGRRITLTGT